MDETDLEVYPGEVLAVIGDNGAGKSTLIKVLSGAVIPDKGELFLNGQQVHFSSPIDARWVCIETVYHNLAAESGTNIGEKLFLGRGVIPHSIFRSVYRLISYIKIYKQ